MRGGLATPSALRRFQYEAELLGRLGHPGVAQVYEAGTFQDGGVAAPFFAMEYIPDAATLINYADAHSLTMRQRLELFAKVCDAVHHGHQNGIVHRDLKPGNILVDSHGHPKVIDFGVARAADLDVQATTVETRVGELVGTVAYMSPEQCEGDPSAVDIRSDVYSLGVVLYELLCGTPPYDVRKLPISSAVRIIKEELPRRLTSVNRALGGDVQTIVLKALAKERDRRYASASDVAQDIRRFLRNQPIEARPPTTAYQFRKLVARHKPVFAALAVLLLALGAFGIAMTMLYTRAESDRVRAENAEHVAREEAQTSKEVSDYLVTLLQAFDPFRNPDGGQPAESTMAAWDILDRSARTIATQLRGQPLTQATLYGTISEVYWRLEFSSRAVDLRREALALRRAELGDRNPEVLLAMQALTSALFRKGDFSEAEQICRQSLVIARGLYDDAHWMVTGTRSQLAHVLFRRREIDAGIAMLRDVLEQRRRQDGGAGRPTVVALRDLAGALYMSGHVAEAEALIRETEPILRAQPDVRIAELLGLEYNLAGFEIAQGRWDAAEERIREVVATARRTIGEEHLETATAIVSLAALQKTRHDLAGAEQSCREALAIRRKHVGEDHPAVGGALYELAQIIVLKRDAAAIGALHEEALSLHRSSLTLPEDHPRRSGSLLLMGVLSMGRGEPAEAERYLRECMALRRRVLSPEHWLTIYAENVLGGCLFTLGRLDEAQPLLEGSVPMLRFSLGPADNRAIEATERLIRLYETRGDSQKAAEFRGMLPPRDASDPAP